MATTAEASLPYSRDGGVHRHLVECLLDDSESPSRGCAATGFRGVCIRAALRGQASLAQRNPRLALNESGALDDLAPTR